MSDLIDRQGVIDLVRRQDVFDAIIKYCTQYDLRELVTDIERLPSTRLRIEKNWMKGERHETD